MNQESQINWADEDDCLELCYEMDEAEQENELAASPYTEYPILGDPEAVAAMNIDPSHMYICDFQFIHDDEKNVDLPYELAVLNSNFSFPFHKIFVNYKKPITRFNYVSRKRNIFGGPQLKLQQQQQQHGRGPNVGSEFHTFKFLEPMVVSKNKQTDVMIDDLAWIRHIPDDAIFIFRTFTNRVVEELEPRQLRRNKIQFMKDLLAKYGKTCRFATFPHALPDLRTKNLVPSCHAHYTDTTRCALLNVFIINQHLKLSNDFISYKI